MFALSFSYCDCYMKSRLGIIISSLFLCVFAFDPSQKADRFTVVVLIPSRKSLRHIHYNPLAKDTIY